MSSKKYRERRYDRKFKVSQVHKNSQGYSVLKIVPKGIFDRERDERCTFNALQNSKQRASQIAPMNRGSSVVIHAALEILAKKATVLNPKKVNAYKYTKVQG